MSYLEKDLRFVKWSVKMFVSDTIKIECTKTDALGKIILQSASNSA